MSIRISTTRGCGRSWLRSIRRSKKHYRSGCGMRIGISLVFMSLGVLSLCAAPREEYKRDFQKTAALAGGRSLRIEHSQGSVNIHTHAKGEVAIAATIRCSANTQAEARSFCDQIRIQVNESGSGVFVRTDYPKTWRGNYGYSANLDIAMP